MKCFVWVVFILMITIFNVNAEILTAKTDVINPDTQKFTAGDRIALIVHYSDKGDFRPKVAEELSKGAVAWGQGRILSWKKDPNDSSQYFIDLTSYTPGEYKIDPIPFVEASKPDVIVFQSEALTVKFEMVEGDREKDEIFHPTVVEFPIYYVVGFGLIGTLISALVVWAIIKKLKSRIKKIIEEVLDPRQEFEKKKNEILAMEYLRSGLFKKHYFAASEMFKRFISRAYSIDLEDKTTSEMASILSEYARGSIFPLSLVDQIIKIFEEMDIVKYTDKAPDLDSANSLFPRITIIVSGAWQMSPVREELEQKKKEANR